MGSKWGAGPAEHLRGPKCSRRVGPPIEGLGHALATHSGSPRAGLVWLGMLGFVAYNDAFYLFGAALNTFFPIYVVLFVLAVGR